jgi:hypothetical protein
MITGQVSIAEVKASVARPKATIAGVKVSIADVKVSIVLSKIAKRHNTPVVERRTLAPAFP